METLQFKTNINCMGCVRTVTNALNNTVGENNWSVDINNPEKTLTVTGENITPELIEDAVKSVGFTVEEK
ncbi:MAG: heavy-metal-associated domain-containing protein [Bacteroidetes bacterium]|nr:MAG: heavy-metal-associated domain-containing protein [Bacteroidota bacterium]